MIRSMLAGAGTLAVVCAACAEPARTETAALAAPAAIAAAPALPPLDLDATPIPLGGKLANPALWAAWKARFLTDQGRVVDTANGMVSHSEGQGYGLLLAVAANDRPAFERIWAWSRANLMVRNDELQAWRFDPDKRPGVADLNNASDGDILAAWALTEAAEFWADASYRVAGRRIAVEVARKVMIYKTPLGTLILPGVAGYAAKDAQSGPVINLSYYIFPAFSRLRIVAPEIDWAGMVDSGLELLGKAKSGKSGLPPEWLEVKGKDVGPAQGYNATFGYNAIRIPLYMAWAGVGERDHYAPFAALWGGKGRVAMGVIDVATGATIAPMNEDGYRAIAALTACVTAGAHFPPELQSAAPAENYYPATLRILALIAAQMRYPSCVKN